MIRSVSTDPSLVPWKNAMRILATHPPRGAEAALADADIRDGIKLFGIRLMRAGRDAQDWLSLRATFKPDLRSRP